MANVTPMQATVAGIALVAGLLVLLTKHRKYRLPYPPGPKGLPYIGSLFELDAHRPWVTYAKWAKEYGDIVSYNVMGQKVILLNKMHHSENLLQKRMGLYGDRPRLIMAQEIVVHEGWYPGTSRAKTGLHKKHRKIMADLLRANTLKDWAHPAETPEVHLFMQRLTKRPDQAMPLLKLLMINVMLSTMYGHRTLDDPDDPLIHRIMTATEHQMMCQVHGQFWVDYMPFLRYLPTWLPGMGWLRLGRKWRAQADKLYIDLWNVAKKQIKQEDDAKANFSVTLLEKEMHHIQDMEGATMTASLLDGGTDTTGASMVIFFIIFLHFPHVMKAAQAEVDKVVGRDRLPSFEDMADLPYIVALMREGFRWRSVAPVAIPHAVIEDDVYEGYLIPKGATVFSCTQNIHHDPDLYPEPEKFRPERFLTENGQINNLKHAGFGFGSRKCLGMHLAEQTLFLLISSFVWGFNAEPHINEQGQVELPSLDPQDWGAELASPPPMNFKFRFSPRDQATIDVVNATVESDQHASS